jgi:hypothetical protein
MALYLQPFYQQTFSACVKPPQPPIRLDEFVITAEEFGRHLTATATAEQSTLFQQNSTYVALFRESLLLGGATLH